MAAPNIVNVSTITGKTAYLTPSNTSYNTMVQNFSGSNKVFKINSIIATNINTSSAYAATVSLNNSGGGGGTNYPIASAISVPINASLIIVDKSTSFYLEEDRAINVLSSSANQLVFVISYEEIS